MHVRRKDDLILVMFSAEDYRTSIGKIIRRYIRAMPDCQYDPHLQVWSVSYTPQVYNELLSMEKRADVAADNQRKRKKKKRK